MRLDVYLDQQRIGHLTHDPQTERFSFRYEATWTANPHGFPLTPALPLNLSQKKSPETHSAQVRRFFENLLPEGQALEDVARAYGLSKGNIFALLHIIGRETAGAIRLMPPEINDPDTPQQRLLTREELSDRINSRQQMPFSIWDGKVRLSIAGHQDKLAVFIKQDAWYLVEGRGMASTHILKPDPSNPSLKGLTDNEFFCMRLARQAGLECAEVQLLHIPDPVLCIRRFDRYLENGRVGRRHIIDGCQLLDIPSTHKYERIYGDQADVRHIRSGASLPRIFAALKNSAQPANERIKLLRWLVIQVLLGNADAHAKNLSFFMSPAGPSLAPAYDLTCIAAFEGANINQNFSLAIGDAFTFEDLNAYEWAQFCHACELKATLVSRELQRQARSIMTSLDSVSAQVIAEGAEVGMVTKIAEFIHIQCLRQLQIAQEIKGMMDIAKP